MVDSPKILFIIPPFPARTYAGKTMGPDYLAGYLMRELGIQPENIEILDLDALPPEKRAEALGAELRKGYDLIGISYLSFQTDEAMDIAKEADAALSELGRRDKRNCSKYVPIIVGNHGTASCESIASIYPAVDAWSVGEGFETMRLIAEALKEGKFVEMRERIPGLVFLGENGQAILSGPAIKQEDIDSYFPPYRKYHYASYNFDIFGGKKTAQMLSALGCPGSCCFCFEGMHKPEVRPRSLDSIRAELDQLIAEGYEAVYFDDSTFTYNRKRALELVALLKEYNEKYGLVWAFNTRVDCLDEELLRQISEAGCIYLFCGVESLYPSVVEGMNKVSESIGRRIFDTYREGSEITAANAVFGGTDYVRRAIEVYASMKKLKMKKSVFLIFGGPSKSQPGGIESFEEAMFSIWAAVWKLEPDFISINILRFIPDAAISSKAKKYDALRGGEGPIHAGYFSSDWLNSHSVSFPNTHPIYSAFEAAGDRYPIPPHMTPEYSYAILRELVEQVNRYFEITGKEITIVVDKEFENYLQKKDRRYVLSPYDDMAPKAHAEQLRLAFPPLRVPARITTQPKQRPFALPICW